MERTEELLQLTWGLDESTGGAASGNDNMGFGCGLCAVHVRLCSRAFFISINHDRLCKED